MDRQKEMEEYMDKEYPRFPNVNNSFIDAYNGNCRNGFKDGVKWADEHLPEPWKKTKETDFAKIFSESGYTLFIYRIKETHEICVGSLVPSLDEKRKFFFRNGYTLVHTENTDYIIAFDKKG